MISVQKRTLKCLYMALLSGCCLSFVVGTALATDAQELPAAFNLNLAPVSQYQPVSHYQGIIGTPSAATLKKGRIYMRRQKAYVPSEPAQSMEERIAKVVEERLEETEKRLQRYADQKVNVTELEMRAIAKNTRQEMVDMEDQSRIEMKRIAKNTVVAGDAQVQDSIRKIVNLAVLESDQPVEYAVRKIMEERFAEIGDDPITRTVRKVAADNIRAEAQKIAQENEKYTNLLISKSAADQAVELQKTQNAIVFAVERSCDAVELAEERSKRYMAEHVVKSNRGHRNLEVYTEQKLAALNERVAVAQEAVKLVEYKALTANKDTEIRTRAYTDVRAQEVITNSVATMQAALVAAAKQVIVDEDNNVAFAIRRIVEQTLDEKLSAEGDQLARAQNFGSDTMISDDEMLEGENLTIGKLQDPTETGIIVSSPRHREDWVNIRDYHVIVHENNETLDRIVKKLLQRAEPFVGPWEVKWKITSKNRDIMFEHFSLDAETTFEQFANYLAQYLFNTRGVPIGFTLFDSERVLVISDE